MASIPADAAGAKPGSSSSASARASATAAPAGSRRGRDATPSFGVMWSVMRSIGDMSLPFFFSSVTVSSTSHVPPSTTPLILCSNHSNTILDVAILASHFPERRPLHFWAKSGFFHNPILRWILTSSGNIKVDRKNKNNQSLFQGTFQAMKAGGAIALFPEGGSYTIPKLAKLKMGAAWAALEYSRHLQTEQGDGVRTQVKILPAAVVFDDKSVFRSRAGLRFGEPLSLDRYIEEFLSSPMGAGTSEEKIKSAVGKEDGTVPATPESMTRTNTSEGEQFASPAHRAVARLTEDLQRAMETLTFNAPDWETFQAVRLARETIFELQGGEVVKEDMEEYVELSRAIMMLLTLDQTDQPSEMRATSKEARRSLFVYSSLLHLSDVDNLTLARTLANRHLSIPLKSFLLRLPIYIPIFTPTLIPTYLLPNALAHHYAGREEESLSSVKTLFSFLFTSMLYSTLLFKTMTWARWSPPGLLVGMAGVWWLHDLNRGCVDGAYSLVKQIRFGWRLRGVKLDASKRVEGVQRKGKSLFFYGTLVHPKILARVIGNDGDHLTVQNAVLDGAKLFRVKEAEYPGLVREDSSSTNINAVKGTLVSGLTDSDVGYLDTFEGDEYIRSSVRVIPDPLAPAERNSTRIANAGNAPLHAILSSLTKPRIASLCASTSPKIEAQVYTWVAGSDKLEDRVWEFDEFAKNHAANWVGEGQVEHEHEYQVVDRVRSRMDSPESKPLLTTGGDARKDEEDAERWMEEYASTLVEGEGRVKDALVQVCSVLREKPSIQYYVDKGLGKNRPKKGDREMLTALLRARISAKAKLEELMVMVERTEVEEVRSAVESLVEAKKRALRRIGVMEMSGDAAWPFSQIVVGAAEIESKKTV
ncbi:hypothetical protein PHSY_006033 [Pseudozyma hubeiensis SY62]|uniref:Phospholipid/glycerol acyltransferase domain-containing protein n=1 Tax=Pseudozyma hubeiensis (strain SY62) TaxID=1305764 RepID=R9PAR9_PSEHS|nr:hypothetical protein PHSY_006033 [Pseudozyma hubeiensis SY62]GAC98439.1 hypothetical protein PHSY_006033 [Pseudozyma hubeiensis SY62]